MYPYEIFFGVGLYEILIIVGLVLCMVAFRMCSDRIKLPAKLHNLCLFDAIIAVCVGYYSAVLFQAFYNFLDSGVFEIRSDTGATFYGGLIGGAATFISIYFIVGHFLFPKKEHIGRFIAVSDIAACSIAIAHSLGRIGCLFAGCCYGAKTDSFIGIHMENLGYKVIPVQLFEALFLLALFIFLTFRLFKGKGYGLPIYMFTYGIWRFLVEYLRDDERGDSLISFLSPSQFTAILMIIAAVIIGIVIYKKKIYERFPLICTTDCEISVAEASVPHESTFSVTDSNLSGTDNTEPSGTDVCKKKPE